MMLVKPAAFQAGFAAWLQSLRATAAAAAGVEQPILSVDGKAVRRSHDRKNGLGALQSVSAWASEFGRSLGPVACAEKSTAITAIPALLRLVDIPGAIITSDAMGAQKAIAAAISDGKGDYVLAWKGNQEALHQAVIEHSNEQLEGDLDGTQEHVTTAKGHGRQETRTDRQLPAPESLPGLAQWKGLKSIGVVTSCCLREGKETLAVRYDISSLAVSVKQFAHAVGGHGGIETSCPCSRDITDREDESRIRDRHLREKFAWLRRLSPEFQTVFRHKSFTAKLLTSIPTPKCSH